MGYTQQTNQGTHATREELHHYDDVGSRIMEQVTRIAAVIQMFITPESSIITKDTFLSAVKISEWCTTHLILKVDANRKPSEKENCYFGLRNMLSLISPSTSGGIAFVEMAQILLGT